MAVSPSAIIEQFNVLVDLGSGDLPSHVDALLDLLLFKAVKERFGHCVIPAVATPAHAWLKMMRMGETPPMHRCQIVILDQNESGCVVARVAVRP
jgi:hypothetical protein